MLKKRIDKHKIISFIGIAKNVGKTTALSSFLKNYKNLGVTTIGIDGDEICSLTGKEKQTIYLPAGTFFTTTDVEVRKRDISVKIVENTDIITPYGNIIIAKTEIPDYAQIYGCGSIADTEKVIFKMISRGAKKVLIDGSFNRVSHTKISAGTILVAGVIEGKDYEYAINETKKMVEFMGFKKSNLRPKKTPCIYKNGKEIGLGIDSILGKEDKVIEKLDNVTTHVVFSGAFTSNTLKKFIKFGFDFKKIKIVLNNCCDCLLSYKEYRLLKELGGKIEVLNKTDICGIAVNSFSFSNYINPKKIFKMFKKEFPSIYVFDVMLKCS